MSIQDILNKILVQAKEEAETVKADALSQAEKDKQRLLEEAETKREAFFQDVEERAEKALRKSKYLAEMEGKNKILQKKSDVIETVLAQVIDKLASMPAKDYEQFLADLLKKVDIKSGTLYPAKGKENSTKGAVKIANKDFAIGDSKEIKGGFIIESDLEDIDLSFEALVYTVHRKALEELIVSKIFND